MRRLFCMTLILKALGFNAMGRGYANTPGTIFIVRPHTSYLDGPAVARWLTRERGIRNVVFAVDPDFAKHPVWRFVLNVYGRFVGGHTMVPLDSGSPFALRKLMMVLRDGGCVAIFPQGTGLSSGPKRQDQSGFLWLVAKTHAVQVSCHLCHSTLWPTVERHEYGEGDPMRIESKSAAL